jgi:ornithine cyclodeaminase/alanine dehydrogenase-like protein (mu-crystallin family)
VFVVTARELRRLVPMADAVEAVGAAFRALSAGEAEQPPRVVLGEGAGLAMAARAGAEGDAYKLVSVRPENRRRGLPAIHALVVWFDGETVEPRLLVEGAALTALLPSESSGSAEQQEESQEAGSTGSDEG